MKLKDILCAESFRDKIKDAVSSSYFKRSTSDIAAVGGAEFEISLCKAVNSVLPDGYVCLTKAIINEDYKFPKDFMKTDSESNAFHPYSASDLFIFDSDNNFLDAISLKTSIMEGIPKPFLHNDSKGQIYDQVMQGTKFQKIGQVFIATYNLVTTEVNCYYYDQSLEPLVSMFETRTQNLHGDLSYKGFGFRRGVLKITNKNCTTRKSQSSFNRGVILDGDFIKEVLVPNGIFENPHSFTLNPEAVRLQSVNELTLGRR